MALLAVSASVALAAERLSAAPRQAPAGNAAGADISPFVAPLRADSDLARSRYSIGFDPFDGREITAAETAVASADAAPTVPSAPAGRALTAILITDDRRVAVIDDKTVGVGDVLKDGTRVSAIQPDRVFVVDKGGRWTMLTLTNRGPK